MVPLNETQRIHLAKLLDRRERGFVNLGLVNLYTKLRFQLNMFKIICLFKLNIYIIFIKLY